MTEAGVALALRRTVDRMRILSREEGELLEVGILTTTSLVVTEKMCCRSFVSMCRNSSIGCVGPSVVDRKGASDYASSFLTAFINSLSEVYENSEIRQWTIIVELDRTCDVELDGCRAGADAPEGIIKQMALLEVGVRVIKAQTMILRSQQQNHGL